MSILENVQTGKQKKARRTMIVGPGGIGKSTFACQFPSAIVIDIEGGVADIDVPKIECKTAIDVYKALAALATETHEYKSVVIDSADWLERLIWAQLCRECDHADIADFGYGQGYSKAVTRLDDFIALFDEIRYIGMEVIIVAHSDIKKFSNPSGESYDRFQPKMHAAFASRLIEWCDEVFFANYKVFTREIDEGFKKTRSVGIGGERVIYTTEAPGHVAKNRLNMPAEIPLAYAEYAKFIATKPKPKGSKNEQPA